MNNRTVLILCPDVPYPPINGPRLDNWGRVEFFKAAGWTPVVVVCRTADDPHRDAVSIPNVITHEVRRGVRWSLAESAETIRRVQGLIDEYAPVVVLCEGAEFAPLAAALRMGSAALWFRAQDYMLAQTYETIRAQGWRRQLAHAAYYLGKLGRIYQIERQMFRIADWVLHIGWADMIAMRRMYGDQGARDWIPPFVERDQVEVRVDKSVLDVVYVSSDYQHVMGQPAADVIAGQIAPEIEARMPGRFRFHMVGDRQTATTSANVEWHGFIDDLAEFMQGMDIACMPVDIGWGCKLKMVEALAHGLPVIGAPQTFRGVPSIDAAAIVCKRVEKYVEALARLADPVEREMVGRAGQAAYSQWRDQGKERLIEALAGL